MVERDMNLSRRSLLIAAPAVILTPHLLMPVRSWHNGIRGEIRWTYDPTPQFKDGYTYYPIIPRIWDGKQWLPIQYNRLDQYGVIA